MNDVRKVDTADAAARVAVDEAVLASLRGTFAVGGCIIDNGTGTVVKTMHNEVLRTIPIPMPGSFCTIPPHTGNVSSSIGTSPTAGPCTCPTPRS